MLCWPFRITFIRVSVKVQSLFSRILTAIKKVIVSYVHYIYPLFVLSFWNVFDDALQQVILRVYSPFFIFS